MNENMNNEAPDALTALEGAFLEVWAQVTELLPTLVVALIVLLAGLIISPILGNFARRLVKLTQVDKLAERSGLAESLRELGLTVTFSKLIGRLVKWFFLVVFLLATVEVLGWSTLTELIRDVVLYLPNVIIAVVILTIGLILGQLLERVVVKKLEVTEAPIKHPELLGQIARWAVVGFTGLAALMQLGVAPELIQIVVAGAVLALALAFGLGGKDKAAELLEKLDGSK